MYNLWLQAVALACGIRVRRSRTLNSYCALWVQQNTETRARVAPTQLPWLYKATFGNLHDKRFIDYYLCENAFLVASLTAPH